jgi:hypothetical protein
MMNAAPDTLLKQLDDIKGLDEISWLPLAPGWWALLALAGLALIVAAVMYWRRRAYWRSWKGDAARALDALAARLDGNTAQEVAGALSVLLRRIAIHRFSRPECAGLQGEDWLRWLAAHDAAGFDWADRGALLNEAPYSAPGRMVSPTAVGALIDAAKRWVH